MWFRTEAVMSGVTKGSLCGEHDNSEDVNNTEYIIIICWGFSEQYNKLRLVLLYSITHISWLVDGCMIMNQQLDHLNIAFKAGDI